MRSGASLLAHPRRAQRGSDFWHHAEAEGVANINTLGQRVSTRTPGLAAEARLTTTNTGGGALTNLARDPIGVAGTVPDPTRGHPLPAELLRGTLAWARLHTFRRGATPLSPKPCASTPRA